MIIKRNSSQLYLASWTLVNSRCSQVVNNSHNTTEPCNIQTVCITLKTFCASFKRVSPLRSIFCFSSAQKHVQFLHAIELHVYSNTHTLPYLVLFTHMFLRFITAFGNSSNPFHINIVFHIFIWRQMIGLYPTMAVYHWKSLESSNCSVHEVLTKTS